MLERNQDDLDARVELGDLLVVEKEPGRAEAEYGEIKKRRRKTRRGTRSSGCFSPISESLIKRASSSSRR